MPVVCVVLLIFGVVKGTIVWGINLTISLNEAGKTYQRPWGSYTTLEMAEGYQVKSITVNPGGRLSLQSHKKRAEHWVVVRGKPTVTVDTQIREYAVNEHIYIPQEAKHRLENFTQELVVLVEVQVGNYLGEDDIIRYEDIYQR